MRDEFTVHTRELKIPEGLSPGQRLPEGTITGYFDNHLDERLCFAAYIPPAAEGAVIVEIGTNGFAEKRAPLFHDNARQGLATFLLERYGHGLSARAHADTTRMSGRDFYLLAEDSWDFHQKVVGPLMSDFGIYNAPKALLSLSQGALVSAFALAVHPEMADAAVLAVPMFGHPELNRAKGLYELHSGLARRHIQWEYGVTGPDCIIKTDFQRQKDSMLADPDCDDIAVRWQRENPQLLSHKVTYGWVDSVLPALSFIQSRRFAKAHSTKTLLLLAVEDECVVNGNALKFAERAPRTVAVTIPEAKQHDMLMDPVACGPALTQAYAFMRDPDGYIESQRAESQSSRWPKFWRRAEEGNIVLPEI